MIYIIRYIFIIIMVTLISYSIYKSYKLRYESFETNNTIIKREDFDCYIINLKKNTERMGYINELYNKSDLSSEPYIRIEAVNGKEIDVKPYVTERVYNGILDIDKTGERKYHSQITRGAIGCYLSHLDIYNQFKTSKKPYALIIEDDAWLNENIYESGIKNILNNIPNNWDIILLGRIELEAVNKQHYLVMNKFWGTHGYLINKSGVSKMLELANIPIDDQIDGVMSKLSQEGKLNIYAPLNIHISSNTDLGSEIQMMITHKKNVDPNKDPYK